MYICICVYYSFTIITVVSQSCICVYVYVCVYIYALSHTYKSMQRYTQTHTHTYVHMHLHQILTHIFESVTVSKFIHDLRKKNKTLSAWSSRHCRRIIVCVFAAWRRRLRADRSIGSKDKLRTHVICKSPALVRLCVCVSAYLCEAWSEYTCNQIWVHRGDFWCKAHTHKC